MDKKIPMTQKEIEKMVMMCIILGMYPELREAGA